MKRATISLPNELEERVSRFLAGQEPASSLTALVQAALERYLDDIEWVSRGYIPPKLPFKVTPAAQGSGFTDTAEKHDEVLAQQTLERNAPHSR